MLAANLEEKIKLIQQDIISGKLDLADMKWVAGSFKQVCQLEDDVVLGLACIREKVISAERALIKEAFLLDFMRSINLPAVQFYSAPFRTATGQYAVILDWISDAVLVDVKDFESAQNKLFSIAFGVTIPNGEGWVLQRSKIETEVREKLMNDGIALSQAKLFAESLHEKLINILSCSEKEKIMISDLQLMITQQGEVSIIDPVDVVRVENIDSGSSNNWQYRSIYDDVLLDNVDFIKQLHDAKNMLKKCIAWCVSIMAVNSASELLEIALNMQSSERVVSHTKPTSLLKGLMGRNIIEKRNREKRSQSSLHQSYSSSHMAAMPSTPAIMLSVEEESLTQPLAELNIGQINDSAIVDLSLPSDGAEPLIFSSLHADNPSDQENYPPVRNGAYDRKNRASFRE